MMTQKKSGTPALHRLPFLLAVIAMTLPPSYGRSQTRPPESPPDATSRIAQLSCEQMRFHDPNDQSFCIARRSKISTSCDVITNSDTKNLCLAQITEKANYCNSIIEEQKKAVCVILTDPAHKDIAHRNLR